MVNNGLGSSCYPLSSKRNEKGQNERFGEEFRAETHQLVKIFEVIGTPPRDDLLKLDDSPMKDVREMIFLSQVPPFLGLYASNGFLRDVPACREIRNRIITENANIQ